MIKTRTFKRILGAVTAAALSLSAVGFSNQIFKYDNGGYELTASADYTVAGITFNQEWTATDCLPSAAGNYWLKQDVVIDDNSKRMFNPPHGINIYLNGHSISVGGNVGQIIWWNNDKTNSNVVGFYGTGEANEVITSVVQGRASFFYANGGKIKVHNITIDGFNILGQLNGASSHIAEMELAGGTRVINCNTGVTIGNGSTLTLNGCELSNCTGNVAVLHANGAGTPTLNVNADTTVNGTFLICQGKKIIFNNNAKLLGTPKVKIFTGSYADPSDTDLTNGIVFTEGTYGAGTTFKTGSNRHTVVEDTSGSSHVWKTARSGEEKTVTFQIDETTSTQQVITNGIVQKLADPDANHTYKYYSDTEKTTEFDFDQEITDNVDIYVSTVGKSYYITYLEKTDDGKIIELRNLTPATYEYGKVTNLSTTATKDGYVLGGWYGSADLTGESITSIAADATGNKTFFAKWKRKGGGASYEEIVQSPFTFRIQDKYVEVVGFDDSTDTADIPTEVNGKPVTSINGAFAGSQVVKKVTIPDSVTKIETGSFYNAGSIEEISIPKTVTEIGANAFAYCASLEKIVFYNKDCKIPLSQGTICNDYIKSKYDYSGEIYGNRGSTAEQYATKFGYKFIPFEGEDSAVYTVFYYGDADEVTAKLCTSEYEDEGVMDKDFVISGKEIWSMRFVVDKYADAVEFSRKTNSGWSTPEKVAVLDSAENFLSKATTLKNGAKCAVVKGEADIVSVAFVEDDSKVMTGTTDENGKLTAINIQDEEDDGTQYFFTIKGEKVTAPTPAARTGYTFLNWEDIKGNKYAPGASVKAEPAENEKVLVIKSNWKRNTHKVSFDLNGGSGNIAAQNVNDGAKAKKPADPKRSGKSFVRWVVAANSGSYVKGSEFNFNSAVTSDVKLVAEWKHVHTYCCLQLNDPIFKGAFKDYCTDAYLAAAHIKMCADVDDYRVEAHHFDANGKCSCGYQKKTEYVTVTILGGASKKIAKNSSYTATADAKKGNQVFNCWGYSTDGRNFKVLSYNHSVTFTVPCNVTLNAFYKDAPLTSPKTSLTAKRYENGLLFRLDYELPDGWKALNCVVSVGDNNQIGYLKAETVTSKVGSNKSLFTAATKVPVKKTVYNSREDLVLNSISKSTLKDKMFAGTGITKGSMSLYSQRASSLGKTGVGYLYMNPSATSQNGRRTHIYYGVGYLECQKPDGSRTTIKLGAIAASYNNPSLVK